MSQVIDVILNGKKTKLNVEEDAFLVDVLRDLGNLSVRRGCDTGCCGLCSIWIDGKPTLSCGYLAVRAVGKEITTIEGIEEEANKFAKLLAEQGADQCGYCSPGFIMTVIAMKKELTNPTDDEIRQYVTGNLCRCTGYESQLRAIKIYLGVQ
ncbi:(2Fe-2S)-binding protein [Clostridium hydrogeniformans]|uniref:(2Fe-2S)-binding protein n=1 Tax=Clostridium hydrogeniformans TaxID=349933 RepID=UPI000559020E|nr:2Fe-2S iron-sulfur cluster-binding protein [Clostridium hydrogeniformans]